MNREMIRLSTEDPNFVIPRTFTAHNLASFYHNHGMSHVRREFMAQRRREERERERARGRRGGVREEYAEFLRAMPRSPSRSVERGEEEGAREGAEERRRRERSVSLEIVEVRHVRVPRNEVLDEEGARRIDQGEHVERRQERSPPRDRDVRGIRQDSPIVRRPHNNPDLARGANPSRFVVPEGYLVFSRSTIMTPRALTEQDRNMFELGVRGRGGL